jgi:hypothetical protein
MCQTPEPVRDFLSTEALSGMRSGFILRGWMMVRRSKSTVTAPQIRRIHFDERMQLVRVHGDARFTSLFEQPMTLGAEDFPSDRALEPALRGSFAL